MREERLTSGRERESWEEEMIEEKGRYGKTKGTTFHDATEVK